MIGHHHCDAAAMLRGLAMLPNLPYVSSTVAGCPSSCECGQPLIPATCAASVLLSFSVAPSDTVKRHFAYAPGPCLPSAYLLFHHPGSTTTTGICTVSDPLCFCRMLVLSIFPNLGTRTPRGLHYILSRLACCAGIFRATSYGQLEINPNGVS